MENIEQLGLTEAQEIGVERNLDRKLEARELATFHLTGLDITRFLGDEPVEACEFMTQIYKFNRGKAFEHRALKLIYGHNLRLMMAGKTKVETPAGAGTPAGA